MTKELRVAIIGGGIGGLTAAIAMLQRGIDVHIYEQSLDIGEVGAGVTLSPNAIKAYRALGLESQIEAIGFESENQVVRSGESGKEISRVHRKGVYQREFGAAYYSMHRADLVNLLARNLPDERIHLGAKCKNVVTGEKSASAHFEDGREIEADLIVGADGIHSAVRRSIFGEEAPRFTGVVCWRGLVPYNKFPTGLISKDLTLYMGPKRHLIHYMVRQGELINFVAHVETDTWTSESWTQECDRSELLDTFAGWNAPLLQLIGETQKCFKWALHDRDPLDKWSKGRVTLLGDSVHAMPPFIGQGACMAIEDGYTLAAMLAHMPENIEMALQRYETIRVPRASKAVFDARAYGKKMHITSKSEQTKRDNEMSKDVRLGKDKTGVNLGSYYEYNVAEVVGSGPIN